MLYILAVHMRDSGRQHPSAVCIPVHRMPCFLSTIIALERKKVLCIGTNEDVILGMLDLITRVQTFLVPGARLSLRSLSMSGVSVCSMTTTRRPCLTRRSTQSRYLASGKPQWGWSPYNTYYQSAMPRAETGTLLCTRMCMLPGTWPP